MSKHLKFFFVNLCLVVGLTLLLLLFMNGIGNEFPLDILGISILISIPIIYFQYPVLNFRKNWIYKALVFYLSMVIFLFLLGMIISWNDKVGTNEAGTWLARFDSGLRMNLFGQIFGGFVAFIVIFFTNLLFKEKLFENKE